MKNLRRARPDPFARAQALARQGELAAAAELCREGLRTRPSFELAFLLGDCLFGLQRFGEAAGLFEQLSRQAPGHLQIWLNLTAVYSAVNDPDRALAALQRAIEIDPGDSRRFSDFLVQSWAMPLTPAGRFGWFRRWNALHARPLMPRFPHWPNDRDPERRLKVGYVSAELCISSGIQLAYPLLMAPDRERFEIYAYHTGHREDAGTRLFRERVDHWRKAQDTSDAELEARIRADGIDLLVDLCGHTRGHRLQVFARRPAPLQYTGLGFVSTTGLDAIQYRFTDASITPPELRACESETPLWLPSVMHWSPVLDPNRFYARELPWDRTGQLSFGCLNLPYKVNEAVLGLWARILQALPHARLIFKGTGYQQPELQARYRRLFAAAGVDPARLDFVGNSPMQEHLAFLRQIDIALDPFPYQGGIVTCECLALGVPVLCLNTGTRTSVSILASLGLTELIAADEADYLARAVGLGQQREPLRQWRWELPGRLKASAVCRLETKARLVEAHYRETWRQWCATQT